MSKTALKAYVINKRNVIVDHAQAHHFKMQKPKQSDIVVLRKPSNTLPDTGDDHYEKPKVPAVNQETTLLNESYHGHFDPLQFVNTKLNNTRWKQKALVVLRYLKQQVDPRLLFISAEGRLFANNRLVAPQDPLPDILASLLGNDKKRANGELQLLAILATAPDAIKKLVRKDKLDIYRTETSNVKTKQTKHVMTYETKQTVDLPKAMKQSKKVKSVSSPKPTNATVTPNEAYVSHRSPVDASKLVVKPNSQKKWYYVN